jgi:hypothetical protein
MNCGQRIRRLGLFVAKCGGDVGRHPPRVDTESEPLCHVQVWSNGRRMASLKTPDSAFPDPKK